MIKKILLVDTIQKANEFVDIAQKFSEDITVERGKYVVDGKSLLGVLSLNLSLPIGVCISDSDEDISKELDKFSI